MEERVMGDDKVQCISKTLDINILEWFLVILV